MIQAEPWYFDDKPSELYERFLVRSKFLPWANYLAGLADPRPTDKILDVACGTGIVTRLIAPQLEAAGCIVGLDFNADRLKVAASLPPTPGCSIEWKQGDAGALPFDDASFDMVFCQQGIQYFPDKPKALSEMHRVLVPDGQLFLGVWRSIEHQPGGLAMADALDSHVSAEAGTVRREPFTFGNAKIIENMVTDAGFRDVVVKPTVKKVQFPSAEAFTKRYISARVPLNEMVAAVDDSARDAVVSDVNAALGQFEGEYGLNLPTAVNIVTGRA